MQTENINFCGVTTGRVSSTVAHASNTPKSGGSSASYPQRDNVAPARENTPGTSVAGDRSAD